MKNILVTGGAGYIGSHTVKELILKGYNPIIYDNLSKGHRKAVIGGKLVKADLSDKKKLNNVFKKYQPEAVIHFAASIEAGESIKKPNIFFENNILNGLNLLEKMVENKTKYIIFSSSAAVYGQPKKSPIVEESETIPENHYGLTKLHFEQILKTYDKLYNLKSISLRYFNASGADYDEEIGEDHEPETHLIPLILKAALGQKKEIEIFGTDYETFDGTCVRDYIHVTDLANAHVLALEKLVKTQKSDVFNLGNGKGFSVRKVINTAKKVTGVDFLVKESKRRPGDPAVLVAISEKSRKELGWIPKYNSLETIIETAWNWHRKNPKGY